MVIAISLIMIYTPFFVVYQGVYLWINHESSEDHTKYKRDKTKMDGMEDMGLSIDHSQAVVAAYA